MKKIVFVIIGIAAAGAAIVGARSMSQTHDDRTEKTSDSSVSAEGAAKLRVRGMIADVMLETSNTSRLSVHAVRWYKGPESESSRRWMNEAHLVARHDGDELSVVDSIEGDSSFRSAKSAPNCGLDLHITVPRGLNVKLDLGVGKTTTVGDFRSVDMSLGAGDLVGRFGQIASSSQVHVGAGKVELDVPRGGNLEVLANAGVGKITGLPESTNEDSKIVQVGDHRSGRFGRGGPKISVEVGAGAIFINSESRAQALRSDDSEAEADRGTREEQLWSGDLDSGVIADQSLNKTLKDIGPTVANAIAMSQSDVNKALKDVRPQMDRDLANVGPEVAKALKDAEPEIDRALAQVGPTVDQALKQAQPEIDREMAKIGPEIERAMREVGPEIERAKKEQRRELERELPEIERAMREAQKALDQASAKVTRDEGEHSEYSKSVRKDVAEALKTARRAVQQAMKAAQEAVRKAKTQAGD